MTPIPTAFINDLILVAAVGLACVLILGYFRLPVVTGLLVAGALMGPNIWALVENSEQIRILSKIGVVMLLFSIGLEFSPRHLARAGKVMALGGFLQVSITTTLVVLGLHLWNYPWPSALAIGFVIALSSTALVLRMLEERGELQAPHGQIIFGALLFQDLAVVPMMLALPVLAGNGGGSLSSIVTIGLKAAGVIAAALIASRQILPWLFDHVKATKGNDLFLLTVILVLGSISWLTAQAGLSVALGAFLAGMTIAGTDHGRQARDQIAPFKDLFLSIFFVSLGMLFDPQVVLERPLQVGILLAVFLIGKGLVATFAARVMKFPWTVALLAGVGLAQFGEFGYILMESAHYYELVTTREMQVLLAAGALSMFISPLAARLAPKFLAGEKILQPLEKLLRLRGIDSRAVDRARLSGHIVVLGYGDLGRTLMDRLKGEKFKVVGLDINSTKIDESRQQGHHVFYGDYMSSETLKNAHCEEAAAAVLTSRNPDTAARAVSGLRAIRRDLPIFVYSPRGRAQELISSLGGSYLAVINDMETLYLKVKRQALFGAHKK